MDAESGSQRTTAAGETPYRSLKRHSVRERRVRPILMALRKYSGCHNPIRLKVRVYAEPGAVRPCQTQGGGAGPEGHELRIIYERVGM